MYYADVTEGLRYVLPELFEYSNNHPKYNKKSKRLVAQAWLHSGRHFDDHSSFAMPDSWFKRLGHHPQHARRVLTDLGLFTFHEGITRGHYTGAGFARPTEKLRDLTLPILQNRYSLWCHDSPLVYKDFRRFSSFRGVQIDFAPTVDTDALRDFIFQNRTCTLDVVQALGWWCMATADNTPNGRIIQSFRQDTDKTHRIVGNGLTIQNQSRELRAALFNNYVDVDISNCFYSLLFNTTGSASFGEYEEAPRDHRHALAHHTGASYDAVKWALLALVFGGTVAARPESSICRFLNPEIRIPREGEEWESLTPQQRDRVKAFREYPLVKEIRKDLKEAQQQFGAASASDFACKLMREEQRCIKAMSRGLRISVPMHDGFIVPNDVDTNEMEKNVMKTTGYNITITKKRIEYDFSKGQGARKDWRNPVSGAA